MEKGLALFLIAALPLSCWPQQALSQLEKAAADPGAAPSVFHGQPRGQTPPQAVAMDSGGAAFRTPALKPASESKASAEPPSPPSQVLELQRQKREGAIWGGIIGTIFGAITGAVTAWGLWSLSPVAAVIAGIALTALGTYIGIDVGKACGPDPECP